MGEGTLLFSFSKRISTDYLDLLPSPPHHLWNILLPLPTFHHDDIFKLFGGILGKLLLGSSEPCWPQKRMSWWCCHRKWWVLPTKKTGQSHKVLVTRALSGLLKSARDPHWKPVWCISQAKSLGSLTSQRAMSWILKETSLSLWWKLLRQILHLTVQKIMYHYWKLLLLFWSNGKSSKIGALIYLRDKMNVAKIDRCFKKDSPTFQI